MCNVGISIENFNPEILYSFNCNNTDSFEGQYHCHDFIEFSYVVSGNVNYKIGDKFYTVKERTLLPFNPGVYHKESFTKGINNDITELHIGFRNVKVDGLPINHILKDSSDVPMQFQQYGEDFHKCCLEIIEEQEACEIGKELILKSLIMKLIGLFLKETNYVKNTKKINRCNLPFYDKSNIVKIIIDYFENNFNNVTHVTHSYKYDTHPQHLETGRIVNNLYENGLIKDCRFFTPSTEINNIPKTALIESVSDNEIEKTSVLNASKEYQLDNKDMIREGIGYKSVPGLFRSLTSDPKVSSYLHSSGI